MTKTEEKYIEIMRSKSGQERLELSLKINNKIFKIARREIKAQYPNLNPISFSRKFYEHLSLKREFYDNLFNRLLKKELNIAQPLKF